MIQSIDYSACRPVINIIRASHMGFCFGVRDAIALAEKEAANGPLTILGDLVHNPSAMANLKAQGIQIADEPRDVRTKRVMVTAHGTSDRTRRSLQSLGFDPLDATCPLVKHAHSTLQRLAAGGYHPVIIGKRGHVEVLGLSGDFDECDIVLTTEDVKAMRARDKFGVIAQTTQPLDRVRDLVESIQETFPKAEVRFEDTVCQPTKLRQASVRELARQCEVMIVIGGKHSNNTSELVNTATAILRRVHRIEQPGELQPEWIHGCAVIGVTAGTSTPESSIQAVVARLNELAEQNSRMRIPLEGSS